MTTIGSLRSSGYDGIEVRCLCQRVVDWPFGLLAERGIRDDYEMETVALRFRCQVCGRRIEAKQVTPWRMRDGQPDVKSPKQIVPPG